MGKGFGWLIRHQELQRAHVPRTLRRRFRKAPRGAECDADWCSFPLPRTGYASSGTTPLPWSLMFVPCWALTRGSPRRSSSFAKRSPRRTASSLYLQPLGHLSNLLPSTHRMHLGAHLRQLLPGAPLAVDLPPSICGATRTAIGLSVVDRSRCDEG